MQFTEPHMFRFSIRELMLMTVIAALGVGWWRDHRTLRNVQDWWVEHATREHASNPNDYKRLIEREWPPICK
jgi:hypothetical protein